MVPDLLFKSRLPVWCQPHELVFAGVDLKARVISERTIEKPERMGKADLFEQVDLVAASHAIGRGTPFPDPVESDDRGFLKWRGEERTCRMRAVVRREIDRPVI